MELDESDAPIHVLDFEGHPEYGIVEYGLVVLRGSVITRTETRFCRPEAPIPERDVKIHGIRAVAAEAAPFADEWEKFVSLRREGPLAAHHAATENRLLKHVWPHPGFVPDFRYPGREIAEWGPWIDTCVLYRELASTPTGGYQLAELVSTKGLQESLDQSAREHCPSRRRRYHCALYDALASALLLRELIRDPDRREWNVARWLKLSQPRERRDLQEELF